MRLDLKEREALKYALKDFKGKIYLFGSRLDNSKKGGDIDILIMPDKNADTLSLSIEIEKKFFLKCEQKLDVIVYKKNNLFCKDILNHAERLAITAI